MIAGARRENYFVEARFIKSTGNNFFPHTRRYFIGQIVS
jgi:hypothetical protein